MSLSATSTKAIRTYSWEIRSPNTRLEGNAPSPTYSLQTFGPTPEFYQVKLWVTYQDGSRDSLFTENIVQVKPSPAPVIASDNAGNPLELTLYDDNSMGEGQTYRWFVEEGINLTGAGISHVYSRPGTYPVAMVTIFDGCSYTYSDTFQIGGGEGAITSPGENEFDVETTYDSLNNIVKFRTKSNQVVLLEISSLASGVKYRNPRVNIIPDDAGGLSFTLHASSFARESGDFIFQFRFTAADGNSVVVPKSLFIQKAEAPLPRMIRIPGGSFLMGSTRSSSEMPVHRVNVATFYMAETETTNEQFCAFLNTWGNQEEEGVEWIELSHPSTRIKVENGTYVSEPGYEKHPVVNVSWYGARRYIDWLNEAKDKRYFLPSEAQWEYAAGGGPGPRSLYAGTDSAGELPKYANTDITEDGFDGLAPVKSFLPNSLGLYDMSGNVYEWCEDVWNDSYEGAPADGSAWREGNSVYRVVRGGSWDLYDPYLFRSSYRFNDRPATRLNLIGFRLCWYGP